MYLPDDVVKIIKEYARPLTCPNWRSIHKMTEENYLVEFHDQYYARLTYLKHHPGQHDYKKIFDKKVYIRMFLI